MKTAKTTSVILGHKNFGELHKLIYLYSAEFGKLRVIAKGARKITSKFTGHLETLNICDAEIYFGPKNIILTEISTISSSKKIRKNLEKMKNALKIAEISNKLIHENQNYDNLLELMKETINYLNNSAKSSLIADSYIIKLLDKIGIIPNFKSKEKYSKIFQFIKTNPLKEIEKINLSKEDEQKIKKLIKRILEYEIEKPIHSF